MSYSRLNFTFYYYYYYYLTAIKFSPSGSSPYTGTDNSNKNKIYIKETIQKHSTNNTKHCKYKYTYFQNTHTIVKTPTHYKTHTYTHPHITKQVKTTTVQDKHEKKESQYIQLPSVIHSLTLSIYSSTLRVGRT